MWKSNTLTKYGTGENGMYTGMADADGYSELTHLEKQQIHQMPQFYSMGVSLGLAYAHPDSGDTMGTVMYGGLKTVQNGPIKANTGQPVQWIFAFEARCFDSKGRRIHPSLPNCIEVCPSSIYYWHRQLYPSYYR